MSFEPLTSPETGAVYRPITNKLFLREPTQGDTGTYSDAIVFYDVDGRREGSRAHLLPRDEWRIEAYDDGSVGLGVIQVGSGLFWVKARLSDFPNDLVSLDDLKRFGVVVADQVDASSAS